MTRNSHILLGAHLIDRLPEELASRQRLAFLFGCIQPDSNPFTYLKGSRTIQLLRGHNYRNAEKLIERFCRQLSQRESWSTLDYYRLGKLIHYTSDAFTFAHNETYEESIRQHRRYEAKLARYFKTSLRTEPRSMAQEIAEIEETVMAAIRETHEQYMEAVRSICTDVEYILEMCEQVFCSLVPQAVHAD